MKIEYAIGFTWVMILILGFILYSRIYGWIGLI